MMKKLRQIFCFLLLQIITPSIFAAAFTVNSLSGGAGPGSLYAAIAGVNTSADKTNLISFTTNGVISLTTSLPPIRNNVTINGFSAPTWSNVPVVSINFNQTSGLLFATGSDGSYLQGLSIVNASTAGVTLQSSFNTLYGNYVGIALDGVTTIANHGGGAIIESTSSNNLLSYTFNLGNTNTTYYSNNTAVYPGTLWQGIRGSATTNIYLTTTNTYLFCGTASSNGILFIGNIEGTEGTNYFVNNPNFSNTSPYGPDIFGNILRIVGSGKMEASDITYGFLYQGNRNNFNNAANYTTITYPNASYNYLHSTMGGLVVGNFDSTNTVTGSSARIYSVAVSNFINQIIYPGSLTDSAYGIWWNGGTSYTICGGYSTNLYAHLVNQSQPIGKAFLVDYDSSKTGDEAFTHWATFFYPAHTNYFSHFEGISAVYPGSYTLSATTIDNTDSNNIFASLVIVPRQANGSFGTSTWVPLTISNTILYGNSVYGYNIIGVMQPNTGDTQAYQTTTQVLNIFNVFSGNVGSGLLLKSTPINFIASCIFDSNTGYGIMATGSCPNTTITGNTADDNDLGAYYLMHATGISLYE